MVRQQPEPRFEFDRRPACSDPVGLPRELGRGEECAVRLCVVGEIREKIRRGKEDRRLVERGVVPFGIFRAVDADDPLFSADFEPARKEKRIPVVAGIRFVKRRDITKCMIVIALKFKDGSPHSAVTIAPKPKDCVMESTAPNISCGRIVGSVTYHSSCHRFRIPSTAAASNRLLSIVCRPAMKARNAVPSDVHNATMQQSGMI